MFFQWVREYILGVGILHTLLWTLFKKVIFILQWPCLTHRYASLFLHAWYHLILGLNFLNLFAELCNNNFSLGFSCLFELVCLLFGIVQIIIIIIILIVLKRLVMLILLLFHHFLSLFSVFLLLIL